MQPSLSTPFAKPLAEALCSQIDLGRSRFHVPAHAGRDLAGFQGCFDSPFALDLTELPPLDVLGSPEGVLKASQQAVANLFGARNSFYLINGASVGIMAALLASRVGEAQQVLVARNCHRSVIHGLVLTGATPQWILPQPMPDWGVWGPVDPAMLGAALTANSNIKAFVLTHPTYEGNPSDIVEIARICRNHGVLLIVDEAHGTLWPLDPQLPVSALQSQADAVIHSLHKSGGSLTQTALLHCPQGSRLMPDAVQEALNLLHTTSPSYLLLANMEATCHWLASSEGKSKIQAQCHASLELKHWITENLKTIRVQYPQQAGFQLYLQSNRLNGEDLAEQLEERFDLAYESALPNGVLLMLNLGLDSAAIEALKTALQQIDKESLELPDIEPIPMYFALPEMALNPRAAYFSNSQSLPAEASLGRISRQVVATCPPGIPILMPGERIAPHHLPFLPESVQVVDDHQ